jgi:MFS family permease
MSGGLAQVNSKHEIVQNFGANDSQVFGRRPVMLCSLFIFAAGSAVCGAAPNMNVLIVGRSEHHEIFA